MRSACSQDPKEPAQRAEAARGWDWGGGSTGRHSPLNPSHLHGQGVPTGMPHTSLDQNQVPGTSLAVQWLKFHPSTLGVRGSIPDRGIKILHGIWQGQKTEKIKNQILFCTLTERFLLQGPLTPQMTPSSCQPSSRSSEYPRPTASCPTCCQVCPTSRGISNAFFCLHPSSLLLAPSLITSSLLTTLVSWLWTLLALLLHRK